MAGLRRKSTAPGDEAGDQAAERPDRQQDAGERPGCPASSAKATVATSRRPKSTPSMTARRRPGARGRATASARTRCTCSTAPQRRLGAALGHQPPGPDSGATHRGGQPGQRVHGRGEQGGDRGADDEDDLVVDRLDREGGVEQPAVLRRRGTSGPGPRRRRWASWPPPAPRAGAAPGSPSRTRRRPRAARSADDRQRRRGRQHPALPAPVDQPRQRDRPPRWRRRRWRRPRRPRA